MAFEILKHISLIFLATYLKTIVWKSDDFSLNLAEFLAIENLKGHLIFNTLKIYDLAFLQL
jgi:hypothetical protein